MKDLSEFDFTTTIKDYDYTMRAMQGMNTVLDSDDFKDMDSNAIFNYLINEMEIVPFSSYLKRYIYEKARINEPFNDVTDSMFTEIIISNFEDRGSPYSLMPTSRKRGAIIKAWISRNQCSREGVFTLGFGLKMTDRDVSDFLTKVLKEEDFNFFDAQEAVYWSCLHRGKGFRHARKLLDRYDSLTAPESFRENLWNAMKASPGAYLLTDENVITYLTYLKISNKHERRQQQKAEEFNRLYERVCDALKNDYFEDECIDSVSPADIEKILYCGVPVTGAGNIQSVSKSLLSEHFQQKMMTRQRINNILKGKKNIERFDLLTMLFIVYATTVEPDWPAERTISYIEECNDILRRCGMMEIYPVNPYESFLLMCMLSSFPLAAYSEVMELSYTDYSEEEL